MYGIFAVLCCVPLYSALLSQLTRGFFEQRYQQNLARLNSEAVADEQRAKDKLYDDLNTELQRQMKVLCLSVCLSDWYYMFGDLD